MTDTETLGTRPGFVVLSVAFVRFSDEAKVSLNLSIPDQQALGLEIDPATHQWWAGQDPAAWQAATCNPVTLRHGLEYIAEWLAWAHGGNDWRVWCHGATFDCPILDELYRRVGAKPPWNFWQVRDTRTLYDLACIDPKAAEYAVPPPHIAVNDAISQVRSANAAMATLARAHQGVAA